MERKRMVDWKFCIDSPLTKSLKVRCSSLDEGDGRSQGWGYLCGDGDGDCDSRGYGNGEGDGRGGGGELYADGVSGHGWGSGRGSSTGGDGRSSNKW